MAVAFPDSGRAQMEREVWAWLDQPPAGLEQMSVQWTTGMGIQLADLSLDKNIAAGAVARDEFGLRVPLTDGEISLGASEWVSNNPNVFGRNFVIDLGHNRAITRVRVLPGQTAINQPEYFIRGYRIEAAKANDPELWRTLAEARTNFKLEIDTAADSTWSVQDENADDISLEGRHVRLTITRQDRSNWVAIGEIEVFAEGREHEGAVSGELAKDGPINVGRVRWDVDTDANTAFELAAVPSADAVTWPQVRSTENGAMFAGQEPIDAVSWRALLSTADPFATPTWRRLEIDYDQRLVASAVRGSVSPETGTRGEEALLTYRFDLQVAADDYGVDLLRLDGVALRVEEVVIDGRILAAEEDYTVSSYLELAQTKVELAPENTIAWDAVVEISGKGLFLADVTVIRPLIGNAGQGAMDGYVNWQNGHDPLAVSQVFAQGAPGELIGRIALSQRAFSPYEDGQLAFDFVVSRLSNATDVSLSIYNLSGNRVRRYVQLGAARAYRMAWDGRDEDARVVDPGLYLYEVAVRGGGAEGKRQGTCVVAY
jgi:hypothetical protein